MKLFEEKSQISKNKTQKERLKENTKNKFRQLENQNKIYDPEERTALFAEKLRDFCLKLPKNVANIEYIQQLIRS